MILLVLSSNYFYYEIVYINTGEEFNIFLCKMFFHFFCFVLLKRHWTPTNEVQLDHVGYVLSAQIKYKQVQYVSKNIFYRKKKIIRKKDDRTKEGGIDKSIHYVSIYVWLILLDARSGATNRAVVII